MFTRLANPLPYHNWVGSPARPGGPMTYTGRRWRQADILPALRAGGWFKPNAPYAWDSPTTAEFAYAAQRVFELIKPEVSHAPTT